MKMANDFMTQQLITNLVQMRVLGGATAFKYFEKYKIVFVYVATPGGEIEMVTARGETRLFKTLDSVSKTFRKMGVLQFHVISC